MAVPIVAALWSGFAAIAVPLAIRVLAGIGLGVATYTGVKALVDEALDMIQTHINSLGADVLQYVAVFRIDQFMTIVFSALVVRLTFMGLQASGAITRMQWRAPS